ncbi:MAG: hypothetical protein EOM20_06605 [Spartobacteria bacterium]|nr:hypothetical protein [Spartobacteria bacterium]
MQAMKTGAMDYLIKGAFSPGELVHAILNALQKTQMRRIIETQRDELLAAERQRVVIESMAAACHHLGQPVTVLSGFLDLINSEISDQTTKEHLLECRNAVERIADLLHKFQALHEYQTEPYLVRENGPESIRMLKIQ